MKLNTVLLLLMALIGIIGIFSNTKKGNGEKKKGLVFYIKKLSYLQWSLILLILSAAIIQYSIYRKESIEIKVEKQSLNSKIDSLTNLTLSLENDFSDIARTYKYLIYLLENDSGLKFTDSLIDYYIKELKSDLNKLASKYDFMDSINSSELLSKPDSLYTKISQELEGKLNSKSLNINDGKIDDNSINMNISYSNLLKNIADTVKKYSIPPPIYHSYEDVTEIFVDTLILYKELSKSILYREEQILRELKNIKEVLEYGEHQRKVILQWIKDN